MPNYCNNQATFNHASSYRIEQVLNAANSNTLFNTFVPINNNDADHDDNLDPRDVWGCKWEASEIVVMNKSDDSITLYFDTPWAPPIAFYEAMEELGFNSRSVLLGTRHEFLVVSLLTATTLNIMWNATMFRHKSTLCLTLKNNLKSGT